MPNLGYIYFFVKQNFSPFLFSCSFFEVYHQFHILFLSTSSDQYFCVFFVTGLGSNLTAGLTSVSLSTPNINQLLPSEFVCKVF